MNQLPKTAERRLNEAKIELVAKWCEKLLWKIGYEELAPLLKMRTRSADLIYDYAMDFWNKARARKDVKGLISQLVSKVQLYDFLITYRKFAFSSTEYDAEAYTYLLWVFALVLELKVGTNIVGFKASTGEVFVNDEFPTVMEAIILVGCGQKNSYKIFPQGQKKVYQYMIMKYGNDVKAKLLKRVFKTDAIAVLSEQEHRAVEHVLLERLFNSGVVVMPTFLCVDKYTPQLYLDSMSWDRETTIGENADFCLMMLHTFGDILKFNNVFKERQKLLSEDGVVLELAKPYDGFSHIKLSEVHEEETDEHYLLITYWNDGAARTFPISLSTPGAISSVALYQVDYSIVSLVMEWLGVLESLVTTVNECTLQEWNKIFVPEGKEMKEEDLLEMKKFVPEAVESIPYEEFLEGVRYQRPSHWNYEGTTKFNHKKTKRIQQGDYFYELRKIGAHVRKLQNGQHASPEKKDAAKRYCLDLKDGYTLVEGYQRRQKVKYCSSPKVVKSIVCER